MKNQTKQSKVYHNTVLLLRSYRDLKEHISGSESLVKIENQAFEDWSEFEKVTTSFEDYLKATKKTKTITVAMMKLVDRYLKLYKEEAINRNDTNKLGRYEVINLRYIGDSLTLEQIAEKLQIDVKTVKRRHNKAIDELGVYFFGIEGLRLEKINVE